MKNTFYLTLAFLFLFSSCTKQKADSPVSKEKIKEVISMAADRSPAAVDAYNMLTDAEKADLWDAHLDSFLLKAPLDSAEIDVINDVKSYLSASFFDPLNRDSLSGTIAQLEYICKNTFSENNYFIIFESWDTSPSEFDKTAPIEIGGGPSGSQYSCYCRSDGWCHRFTGSDLAGCLWNICESTSGGCGLLGFHSCRGRCNVGGTVY